ncbi:hypothetical protein AURDEDRAFT_177096 [Auricularia subglabra TFB-10046 SS5]|uniref:Retrotransposon gag domain-containing protein n=1 Tax=Auricularia subglabra (strain TFB-10046 / SS5) TaxID=717982 RepID=J0LBK3_AURST|nr:hypothetical protein AURDEDRAFT_177096 [Auricularia subglabra TFB-10046 SS5]
MSMPGPDHSQHMTIGQLDEEVRQAGEREVSRQHAAAGQPTASGLSTAARAASHPATTTTTTTFRDQVALPADGPPAAEGVHRTTPQVAGSPLPVPHVPAGAAAPVPGAYPQSTVWAFRTPTPSINDPSTQPEGALGLELGTTRLASPRGRATPGTAASTTRIASPRTEDDAPHGASTTTHRVAMEGARARELAPEASATRDAQPPLSDSAQQPVLGLPPVRRIRYAQYGPSTPASEAGNWSILGTLRQALAAGVQSIVTPRTQRAQQLTETELGAFPSSPSPQSAPAPGRRESVASVTSETFAPTAHSSRLRHSVTFDVPDESGNEVSVYDTPTPTVRGGELEDEESEASRTVIAVHSPPPEYSAEEYDTDSSDDRVSEVPEVPEENRDNVSFFDELKKGWYTGWGRPIESDKKGPRRTTNGAQIMAVTATVTDSARTRRAVEEAREAKRPSEDKGKGRDPRERPNEPRTPARPAREEIPAPDAERRRGARAAREQPAREPPETPTPATSRSRAEETPRAAGNTTAETIRQGVRQGRRAAEPVPSRGEITRLDLAAGQPTTTYVRAPKGTNAPSQPPAGILRNMLPRTQTVKTPFLAHGESSRILSTSLTSRGGGGGGGGNGDGGAGGGDPDDDDDADPDANGGDPDGPPDNDDDDEEDEDEEERQRRMIRNLKLPMPSYDGSEDLSKYEAFVYEWDDWLDARQLSERRAVRLMGRALTGDAKEWFMEHVALGTYPWTTPELYQEMYEVFFSDDFREELRNKLMKSKQRGRRVKDFAKDLEKLAIRYPDVDEYAIRRIFWDGADDYIRLFWADKGRSLEFDDINTLMIYALRAEKRERLKKKLTKQSGGYSRSEETSGSNGRSATSSQPSRGNRWRPHGQIECGHDELPSGEL